VPCYSGSCPEVYLEKAFDNKDFRPKQRLINAKKLGETSLMFLVHPTLTKEEIKKTCDVLTEVALISHTDMGVV
jgi:dTDP-4-amino-4,6-dideoxygalactose transaminase